MHRRALKNHDVSPTDLSGGTVQNGEIIGVLQRGNFGLVFFFLKQKKQIWGAEELM